MTDADLTAALAALNMTKTELAAHLGRSERQVARWVRGDFPVPLWAAREVMRLVDDRPKS